MREILLLVHPTFGVLGVLASVWVFVETLNATQANQVRIRAISLLITVFIVLTWLTGGHWYVTYYDSDRATILNGPWPFAHNFFMEAKEHLFFITLMLALYIPIAVRNDLAASRSARALVLSVTGLIALSGLALEGAGAVMGLGVEVGLRHAGVQ